MTRKNVENAVSHQRLKELLDYSPSAGAFAWKDRETARPASFARDPGSVAANGRKYIKVDDRLYLAHRLAWFYVNGEWPKHNISPKNGDYLDLRFANLKLLTPAETTRKHYKGNRGAGVSWDKTKKKWFAKITVNYKQIAVGRFRTKAEAIEACNKARKHYAALPQDNPDAPQRRETYRVSSNVRRLWAGTVARALGHVGWASLEDFERDIERSGFRLNTRLVPINVELPIGPGNWAWEETMHRTLGAATSAEGKRAYDRARRIAFPEVERNGALLRAFGITLADYDRMHAEQDGKCAICRSPETEMKNGKLRWLSVDHDHRTGKVRQLLCGACNRGIGKLRDDPELMRRAADYLRKHQGMSDSPE